MKKISVLLATNSDKAYQYLVPADFNIKKGMIVKAPFRSRELFGIIWDDSDEKIEKSKLKELIVTDSIAQEKKSDKVKVLTLSLIHI